MVANCQILLNSVCYQVGYECVSLAWHPSGGALAAGSTEGHLVVLNADAGTHVATLRVCGSPLNCLQYNTGRKGHFTRTARHKRCAAFETLPL